MRYVKYVGPSHQRMILASEWRSVGITADTVVWSAHNGFAIPLDHFSDDQIRKAIENDPFLLITGDDEEFTPEPKNRDMTPAEAESPRVDVLDTVNGESARTDTLEASGSPSNVDIMDVPDDKPATNKSRK